MTPGLEPEELQVVALEEVEELQVVELQVVALEEVEELQVEELQVVEVEVAEQQVAEQQVEPARWAVVVAERAAVERTLA